MARTKLGDFRLGCEVVGSDGEPAGTVASVLVEKEGFDPQALVVRAHGSLLGRLIADERYFITDEVVVPIADVRSASREKVSLSIKAAAVRKLPAYLSHRFVQPGPGVAGLEEADVVAGGIGLPSAVETANKPVGQLEIADDENVMLGKTGRRLGTVQEVLLDGGELVGIVLKPNGFFTHEVVLPIRFITRADDMALFAEMSETEIERLKPFEAEG